MYTRFSFVSRGFFEIAPKKKRTASLAILLFPGRERCASFVGTVVPVFRLVDLGFGVRESQRQRGDAVAVAVHHDASDVDAVLDDLVGKRFEFVAVHVGAE